MFWLLTGGLFFLSSLFLGKFIINYFDLEISFFQKFIGNLFVGSSFLSGIIFFQSYFFPFNKFFILITLILPIFLLFFDKNILAVNFSLFTLIKSINKKDFIKFGVFSFFYLILFIFIWSLILIPQKDGWHSSCQNCFGDWSAHLTYATSFVYGNNWPPELPILSGEKFSYPFLMDFISALLVKLGLSLPNSFVIPGFIFSLGLVFSIYNLARIISGKMSIAILSTFLFFLNGSWGFWWFFQDIKKFGWQKIGLNLPREYTHLSDYGFEFANILTTQILPQRGFLLGLGVALFVYLLFWKFLENKKNKYLFLAGISILFLPLIHIHTFLAVGFVGGIFFIFNLFNKKMFLKNILAWLGFFVPYFISGSIFFLVFYGNLSPVSNTFIRWQPGWLSKPGFLNWIIFWFKNLGLIIFLSLGGFLLAKKKIRRFSLPFFGIFIMANLFIFQPWDWDNSKLFVHGFLFMTILASIFISNLLRHRKFILKTIGVVVFSLAIFAGSLDVVKLLQYDQHQYLFWNNNQLSAAKWIRGNTNPEGIFLTSSIHNHWLPVLAGRKIVLGYEGWLWSYGLNYQKRKKQVAQIFAGTNDAKHLLRNYDIDYVLIGPEEQQEYQEHLNKKYFDNNFFKTTFLGKYNIYKITQ